MTELGSRPVDLPADEQLLLTFHVRANFHSDSEWAPKAGSMPTVRSGCRPVNRKSSCPISKRRCASRTPSRVYLADGDPAAFAWVVGYTIAGYDVCVAEILRSDAGASNERSKRLHERAGLKVHRHAYEKLLRPQG